MLKQNATDSPGWRVRPMAPGDEAGKGWVHYKSWQEAYGGLVDQGYLDRMRPEQCVELARRFPESTLVAEAAGKIVGFAAFTPGRDQPGGEIIALYVLEAHQRRGIGKALLKACLERLEGLHPVYLWVLQGNEKAIRFYGAQGFRPSGLVKTILLGRPVQVLQLVRQDACAREEE